MPVEPVGQASFARGIYRGRKAPPDSVFDAVNLLVDDEGHLFRRGGTAFKSAAAAAPLTGLWDGHLAAGQRTVMWSETAEDVYALDADDTAVIAVSSSDWAPRAFARGAVVGGALWLPGVKSAGFSSSLNPIAYGGSRKTSNPSNFSGSFTNGSRTMTATGTSFTTSADAGMIVVGSGGTLIGHYAVVARVVSDIQLELVDPWAGPTNSGTTALQRLASQPALLNPNAAADPVYVAAAGGRLIVAQGGKVAFTPRGLPFRGNWQTDYHDLPGGAVAVGADAIEDTAVIFTTQGVWAIRNLALDPVDFAGNVQHQVEQVSQDVILWGDPGIAAWRGAHVVPAVDDVFLFTIDGNAEPISEAIRPLYRDYVKQGYQPGPATVHRGHYLLPILAGTGIVDVLVCRLDREEAPWTRLFGHARSGAYAQRVGAETRAPKLLGLAGARVTDLSGIFEPDNRAVDADGNAWTAWVDTRDYPTSATNHPGTVTRLRLRYELAEDFDAAEFAGMPDDPLSAPWEPWHTPMLEVDDGALVPGGTGYGDAQRPETVGPDCFAQAGFTAPVPTGYTYGLAVRLSEHTGAADGYLFELLDLLSGHSPRIRLLDAGTVLATGALIPAGTARGFRVEADGPVIRGLALIGGKWVEVVRAEDSTYQAAGHVGLFVQQTLFTPGLGIDAFSWGFLPVVQAEFGSDRDPDPDGFIPLPVGGGEGGRPGGRASDGTWYSWWPVVKRREKIRFRVLVSRSSRRFVLRSIEALVRQSGLR